VVQHIFLPLDQKLASSHPEASVQTIIASWTSERKNENPEVIHPYIK
jgi:hypothetical protein